MPNSKGDMKMLDRVLTFFEYVITAYVMMFVFAMSFALTVLVATDLLGF
jgi:pilus assembly protein TadC